MILNFILSSLPPFSLPLSSLPSSLLPFSSQLQEILYTFCKAL
jgi:hypothetical protein